VEDLYDERHEAQLPYHAEVRWGLLAPGDPALEGMTMAREELHQLVDGLGEEAVASAAELLRDLAAWRSRQRSRPSWFGALRAGPDFAERSGEILRTGLGRPA
jgi:hypothetical protein